MRNARLIYSWFNQRLGQEVAMETFGLLGFVFGIFGIIAFGKVIKLQKDVETLKETIQKLGGESDSATKSI